MKIQKIIDVRLQKKLAGSSLRVVQYDTGVQLVFNVLDFELPSDTTATLYVRKKSGKFVYQEKGVTVSGNTVTVDLENQALTEHGEAFYQLRFLNGDDVISTFSSSMWVDRSLVDADAVESQTVISAFDKLADEMVAEFQVKAEQIVAACIATIPDDYSTLEAKVNEQAYAIKGKKTGTVVVADDVSPVEHEPEVWVHGKNLIVYPYAEPDVTRYGVTFTVDKTGITLSGTATQNTSFNVAYQYLKTIQLKKGKTYTLSCGSNFTTATGYVYLQNVANGMVVDQTTVRNGVKTFTASADGYVSIGIVAISGATYENEKVTLQLAEGSVATSIEPYIDPTTVTVTRYGKNLACGDTSHEYTNKGLTITRIENSSEFVLSGTATASFSHVITKPTMLAAGTYTVSVHGLNNVGSSLDRCYAYDVTNSKVLVNSIMTGSPKSFTIDSPCQVQIEVVFGVGTTYNKRVALQMEYGSKATDYEPYQEAVSYIPSSDGSVSGLTTLSPNMTVLTDTDGVIVEVEYNVDTEKFIMSAVGVKSTNITMYVDSWVDEGSYYSQVVTVNSATANSKIDLQPSPSQLAEFVNDETSLTVGNDNGTVTVYAVGGKPDEDITIQALITEVYAV